MRRTDAELPFVSSSDAAPGPAVLLDTTVYVDTLQGSLPSQVEAILRARHLVHVTVAVAELAHNLGRLDPTRPGNAGRIAEIEGTIADIPPRGLETPTAGVALEAGILAGLVFRLGGFGAGQEVAALNDATIYLHALDRGHAVLTRNVRDFDAMNQIVPGGRMLLYRDRVI